MLLPPLILMAIYLLVFNVLWRPSSVDRGYPLYLLAGLATWVFFATTLQIGSRAMLDNAELIRKTRFPRQLVAFSVVGANVVTYAVMLVILLVASFVFVPESRETELLAVPLAAGFVCFVAGLTLIIACLDVVYPRRRAPRRRAAAAVVLPDAGVLGLEPVHAARDDRADRALRESRVAAALRDPRSALGGQRAARSSTSIYLVCAAVVALALGAFTFRRLDDRIAVEL